MASPHRASQSHSDTPHSVGLPWTSDDAARLKDLYLTTHSTHNRQTSIPQAVFELTVPAFERSQTHALDRADAGISIFKYSLG
jgi:hypothetical protein